ncbi:hypothetical protein V3C99_012817 [Haemonchus contortus]
MEYASEMTSTRFSQEVGRNNCFMIGLSYRSSLPVTAGKDHRKEETTYEFDKMTKFATNRSIRSPDRKKSSYGLLPDNHTQQRGVRLITNELYDHSPNNLITYPRSFRQTINTIQRVRSLHLLVSTYSYSVGWFRSRYLFCHNSIGTRLTFDSRRDQRGMSCFLLVSQ